MSIEGIAYLLVAAFWGRRWAGTIAWKNAIGSHPDWRLGAVAGAIYGLLWPAVLAVMLSIGLVRVLPPFPFPSKVERVGRAKRELAEHERRLKDVGMKP